VVGEVLLGEVAVEARRQEAHIWFGHLVERSTLRPIDSHGHHAISRSAASCHDDAVATKFEQEQQFDSPPAAVMAMLRDPDYIRLKCDRTGSLKTEVDVAETPDGRVVLTCTRVLPANVPSAAKKFVGDTITVTETQTWTPPAADGSASATGTVEFSAPLSFTATVTLAGSGAGTLVRTTGSFKAGIPFIGGTIEGVAVDMTTKYLNVEQTVGNEWLARPHP